MFEKRMKWLIGGCLLLGLSQLMAADADLTDAERQQLAQLQKLGAANTQNTSEKLKQNNVLNVNIPSKPENDPIEMQAFAEVAAEKNPLTPEQILTLRRLYEASHFAAASPGSTPPKPVATSQIVPLEPGATPPVIRMSQGFVSTLVFLDSTGAPWPIVAYNIGDSTTFNVQWNKKDNVLMIQPQKLFSSGNIVVRLKGLNTPVMLSLILGGQQAVDYRVDLRISAHGPHAKVTPFSSVPDAASPVLLGVLEGVAPGGTNHVSITGGKATGWANASTLFLRTRYTVLSPGWVSKMTSADGMHAYEMRPTTSILVSDRGKIKSLKLEA